MTANRPVYFEVATGDSVLRINRFLCRLNVTKNITVFKLAEFLVTWSEHRYGAGILCLPPVTPATAWGR